MFMLQIAQAVKQTRINMNMSHHDLADTSGITHSFIIKVEKAKTNMNLITLIKLLDFLQLTHMLQMTATVKPIRTRVDKINFKRTIAYAVAKNRLDNCRPDDTQIVKRKVADMLLASSDNYVVEHLQDRLYTIRNK